MATAIECALFFKRYQHPIDNSPYGKMPKHLKPMLDFIIDTIEADYEFDSPIIRKNITITSIHQIRVLELNIHHDAKFYVVEEGKQWVIYDEEEFDTLLDGEEYENTYTPPN